jgi:microcystin-dependent protein
MKQHAFGLLLVVLAMVTAPPAKAQNGNNYLGEIKFVSFNFAPQGWALCNGQTLPIKQFTVLFNLIGTTYGGDGVTTFNLPNLQGRVPLHQGDTHVIGQSGGAETVTLTVAQMPKHHHTLRASSATADSAAPGSEVLANSSAHPIYNSQRPDADLTKTSIGDSGGSQPVATMPPYLTLNCIIALEGIYPTQN